MNKNQEESQKRNTAIDSLRKKLSHSSESVELNPEEKDILLDLRSEVMKWSDDPEKPSTPLQKAYLNKLAIKEKKVFIVAKIKKN